MTLAKRTRSAGRAVRGAAQWAEVSADAAGLGLPCLGSRELGTAVTDHRTSWVRVATIDSNIFYIKTYVYPDFPGRLRGAFRNTWLSPSRAVREWDALSWLRSHGFGGAEPIAAVEWRCLGLLSKAVLVSRAWPGTPVDLLARQLDAPRRATLRQALETYVDRLHARGFRDRNLDPRNLLARQDPTGCWEIAKVDSPRWCQVQPGRKAARLAREDWQRLLPQLAAIGISAAAAAEGLGDARGTTVPD